MTRFIRTMLVASALLAGCRGTEPGALRLDISLDKALVASSDSVRLSLTLTNTSWRTVKVLPANAYGLCMRAFQVFDAQDQEVAIPGALCLAILSIYIPEPVDLLPGQHIVITDWWHPGGSRLNGQPLPPGTYQVRGRAAGDDRQVLSRLRPVTLLP